MNPPANIIVCGGRVGRNLTQQRVWRVMDALAPNWPQPFRIVQGAAQYADKWSGQWAVRRGHAMQPVPIDPRFDGDDLDAPFRRNQRMADHFPPYACVGFPGGNGTLHMMTICHDLGVPVADVDLNHDGTWEIHWWPQK